MCVAIVIATFHECFDYNELPDSRILYSTRRPDKIIVIAFNFF